MARTGRPREFDTEAALEGALLLFWEHGYEATSLTQLKAAMGGISTASFYAAFGSKEALFRAVVTRYLDTHGRVTAPLKDPAWPPRAAIEHVVASGELQDGTDANALATLFEGILVGLSTQARDGVPLASLETSITQLMSVWDALATAPFEAGKLTRT